MTREQAIDEYMKDYNKQINEYKKKPRKTKYHVTNRINDKFISELRKERFKLGLTQKEMASRLGISYDIYKKYESGERTIFSEKMARDFRVFDYKILTPNKEIWEC